MPVVQYETEIEGLGSCYILFGFLYNQYTPLGTYYEVTEYNDADGKNLYDVMHTLKALYKKKENVDLERINSVLKSGGYLSVELVK